MVAPLPVIPAILRFPISSQARTGSSSRRPDLKSASNPVFCQNQSEPLRRPGAGSGPGERGGAGFRLDGASGLRVTGNRPGSGRGPVDQPAGAGYQQPRPVAVPAGQAASRRCTRQTGTPTRTSTGSARWRPVETNDSVEWPPTTNPSDETYTLTPSPISTQNLGRVDHLRRNGRHRGRRDDCDYPSGINQFRTAACRSVPQSPAQRPRLLWRGHWRNEVRAERSGRGNDRRAGDCPSPLRRQRQDLFLRGF